MDLREGLGALLEERKEKIRVHFDRLETATEDLRKMDLRNALYRVRLRSLWEKGGGVSTETLRQGTLKSSVKAAEAEFMKQNNVGSREPHLQAEYKVSVYLGQFECNVPKEYWEQYVRVSKKDKQRNN